MVADQDRELHLAELTGNRGVLYGLPAILAVAGHSPAANAFRSGRPLWLTPKELATFIEDDPHHFPTRIRDGARLRRPRSRWAHCRWDTATGSSGA
ncbi:hypothetical protein WKI68_04935 [Streptomyces sp. MS1.HAVA.3]|uniref:Uncharacterized protein n=1 Tax=Streptomyces caledonius TaxID=3134107 RepID=A0ABU8TZB9_9ACTN